MSPKGAALQLDVHRDLALLHHPLALRFLVVGIAPAVLGHTDVVEEQVQFGDVEASTPARPIAARMRPRFGSEAKNAVFTSGECVIEYAILRHSSTLAHSSTVMAMVMVLNLVAPSPSRMICYAGCARC